MKMKKLISAVSALTIAISGIVSFGSAAFAEDGASTAAASENDILWGDANCDGEVGMGDAVFIMQCMANPDTYKLSEEGKTAADVYNNGDGITAADALSIQRLEAKLIDNLPESYQQADPDPTKPIYVNSDNLLIVSDRSLFGLTREELSEKLGEEIPESIEFPWYHVAGLSNTDYVYNGKKICFMFQYGKLVMIIYDTMNVSFDMNTYNAAVEHYGEGTLESNLLGETKGVIQLGDGWYYEILDDYYEETQELCVHQRYVSNQYDPSPLAVNDDGVFVVDNSLFGLTREEISSAIGEEIPEPADFPWWGVSLCNTDYYYHGNKICFMFQNVTENGIEKQKLVMLIYDVMNETFNDDVYEAAQKLLGEGVTTIDPLDGSKKGEIKINDKIYYEILDDYYEETGELCYHQRYVTNDIIRYVPD